MKSSPASTDRTAHAIFPLSLLEAMRGFDRPMEDGVDAANHETRARRLGLSSTVASQIERYRGLAKGRNLLPHDEVASVFRLVSRRPDAELVLADAGRRAARHAARSAGLSSRMLRRSAPRRVQARLGLRVARRLSQQVFGARLAVGAAGPEAEMEAAFSPAVRLGEGACSFHGAALNELLRFLTGFEGAFIHESCCSRGDEVCRWRSLVPEEHP